MLPPYLIPVTSSPLHPHILQPLPYLVLVLTLQTLPPNLPPLPPLQSPHPLLPTHPLPPWTPHLTPIPAAHPAPSSPSHQPTLPTTKVCPIRDMTALIPSSLTATQKWGPVRGCSWFSNCHVDRAASSAVMDWKKGEETRRKGIIVDGGNGKVCGC